jgi:hypothetical protein
MVSKKISEFNVSTSLNTSDLFTFVVNGTNKNVSFSNFKSALGVTGELNQVGDPLGAPVLDVESSTVNNIRNLEDGAGVSFSVSAQNGVTGKWNVAQDSVGFPLTSGLINKQPVISSLIAGTGVNIAQGIDSLTISATGETTPTNTVIINQESDFPIQDATTITLSAKTRYVIGSAISSAKRFICEDGFVFTAENQFGVTYTYTGTGDMFSSTLAGGTVEDISLDAPNASQGFNMSDTGLTKLFICRNIRFDNVPKWGTYTGFVTTIISSSSSRNSDDGLTIAGTGQLIVNMSEFAILSSSATCVQVDLGAAVISNIEMNNLILVAPAGGIQVKGATSSANVPAGLLAMMTNSSILGGATQQLSGITNSDIRWDFSGNNTIPNSISDGLIHTEANALETTISSIGVPVKLNAVFLDDDISRFTHDGTGRLTYIGEVSARLPIDITTTVKAASGGDKQIGLCIALNGSPITTTCVQGTASSTKLTSSTTIWQHDFVSGDYIEPFVSNETDTINVIASQCVVRIN